MSALSGAKKKLAFGKKVWYHTLCSYGNAENRKIALYALQERLRRRLEAGLEDKRLVRLGAVRLTRPERVTPLHAQERAPLGAKLGGTAEGMPFVPVEWG